MKEITGKGTTYELAVENALQKLGVTREEVEIEPLQESSKGFLGLGKKQAEVRAVLRGDNRMKAAKYMKSILTHMEIETELDVKEENETIYIHLGEAASPLIGHRGQTLDALQYLVARYLNEDKDDWNKVVIDIDNYRDRREDSLRGLAEKLADQVIRSKRDAKTDPLTAPERRIIHMTLKERPEISTFSIGEGNRKRVVIASTERSGQRRRSRGGRGRGGGRPGGRGRGNRSGGGKRTNSRSNQSSRQKQSTPASE